MKAPFQFKITGTILNLIHKKLLLSLFAVLSSATCFGNAPWNKYHESPFYRNFDGKEIVLKNMPSLPLELSNQIDVSAVQSYSPLTVSASVILDSLLRVCFENHPPKSSIGNVSPENSLLNNHYNLWDTRLDICVGVESYLVYTTRFDYRPRLFLLNLVEKCLRSIMLVSFDESNNGDADLTAEYYNGRIELFENGYFSMCNGIRYVSSLKSHLKTFSLNERGLLSEVYSSGLFYSRSSNSKQHITNQHSNALIFANYVKDDIILSNLPECPVSNESTVDIKQVTSTPITSFTPEEAATIGPALCKDNWAENDYYWLNQVRCRDEVTSYLVLTVGFGLYNGARIFMVNVRDKQVMSVARVSSMNGYYAWHPRPYIHSFLNKGIITVHNDYGEMALSPMTVVRDGIIEDDDVIEDVCFEPLSVNEKYEVLHSFDFYESNMPKSSKYELLLDKDGYLTRK